MMNYFEMLPEGSEPSAPDAIALVWPADRGSSNSVTTDVGAWLGSFGQLPSSAIDLVRIAASAYMADRLSTRGQGFTRTITIRVRLVKSEDWSDVVDQVSDLLFGLTGDRWIIELANDEQPVPAAQERPGAHVTTVALLSGGLDSFCGATIAGPADRIFLGHWDNSLIKGAQNRVRDWLDGAFDTAFHYEQIRIVQRAKKKESSSRSRAFLFMALAVALAAGRGAEVVEIPENGFTSLNPPLGPERGGALSTRSTHPLTIARFNSIVENLGLMPRVVVPYADLTKSQLVAQANARNIPNFAGGVARTLSCGKLDGGRYKGGNPNFHCGLCFPCIVRRAGIAAAGVVDETPYLPNILPPLSLELLRKNRRADISAVKRAVAEGLDEAVVLALGPFPQDFDIDAAIALCEAGVLELGAVDLD
jgi:7-cyano-7-deazaguanine synthase in queuosine biosynthesis